MPRFTTKISAADLWSKFISDTKTKLSKEEFDNDELNQMTEDTIAQAAIMYNVFSQLNKDLKKVNFGCENLFLTKESFANNPISTWLGPQQIGDLAFIGGYAGGDWEIPVAFAIYHDGKKWRGYIPEDGNSYNHKLKSAYGNNDDYEDGFVHRLEIVDVAKIKNDIAERIQVR
jgi:hypothetical protein